MTLNVGTRLLRTARTSAFYNEGAVYTIKSVGEDALYNVIDEEGDSHFWVEEALLERFTPVLDPNMLQHVRANELPPVPGDAPKQSIADEAVAIVNGARRSAYGDAERNFDRIATFWQAYFQSTGRADAKITAKDVSPMMRLMKEARLCETPDHRDSFVDIIGYALTGAEINGVK